MELIIIKKSAKIHTTDAVWPIRNGGYIMANASGISVSDTISKAMEGWLYRNKKNDVKVATFDRLLASFALLKHHRIANIRLMDLCADDIQQYLNTLADVGYSASTIKKGYNLLTSFLRFVIGEGLPVRPAYLNAKVPRAEHIKKKTRRVDAYDPQEQQLLRNAIESSGTTGAKAMLLMIETGMRVGEVLALRWSDIIWPRRAVNIHATLVKPQGRKKSFIQNSPKSRSSERTIPLSKAALAVLSSNRKVGDGLIFTSDGGQTSIGYNSLRKQVMEVCRAADVEYRGMHVFRHTFATNAFYKGCDIKILSKLLGHASVTITYNTYIHLYGDALEDMRSIVD